MIIRILVPLSIQNGLRIGWYEHPNEFYKFDDRYVVNIWALLKQIPVSTVHEKILEQQVEENQDVEKKIRTQLDNIQSAGRIE